LAAAQAGKIRRRVQSLLRRTFPKTPDLSASITVACGGNAEALSRIAPGFTTRGVRTLDMPMLQQQAAEICRSSVLQRMRRYNVHRDRAEVMGIAAIVLLTLARRFKINFMLVPGVGVREGILCELARAHYQGGPS
jgi:exopolyphosphatase/guanosine-5'-triphosphate,3'-diphosphate pyrophosphatase